jgi:hypothetical protein
MSGTEGIHGSMNDGASRRSLRARRRTTCAAASRAGAGRNPAGRNRCFTAADGSATVARSASARRSSPHTASMVVAAGTAGQRGPWPAHSRREGRPSAGCSNARPTWASTRPDRAHRLLCRRAARLLAAGAGPALQRRRRPPEVSGGERGRRLLPVDPLRPGAQRTNEGVPASAGDSIGLTVGKTCGSRARSPTWGRRTRRHAAAARHGGQ